MRTEFERAEQKIETRSESLKKPLGLFDLVLTQILFVVGSSWVGTAAKLGQAHLFFWLLAILLFYIPQAAVVIYLSNRMPLEGGIYQWAKLGFNEFAGFIVAWNLWLLSITVIALGGMFVTTNVSYAIGPGAAWMPENKWCVSLISAALVGGLGWTCVRGLSLGKWVHNIGAFAMFIVYASLILLPLLCLARGELKTYQPLQFALPAMSLFYCFNIFSKLAVGALSGFEYVAILAGETRAPARDIGRSVLIASPVIALAFIFGTSSGTRVRRQQSDRPDWSGAANASTRAQFFSNSGRHRISRNSVDDHANDCFDQRSRYRQLAITNGGGVGSAAAKLVFASASAIQNTGEFHYFRRRNHTSHRHRQPDRRRNSGSISTRRQRSECFLRHCLLHDVRNTDFWRGCDSFGSPSLVAYCGDLWCCGRAIGDFFHHLPNYRRAESA